MKCKKNHCQTISLLFNINFELTKKQEMDTTLNNILNIIAKQMGLLKGILTIFNRQKAEISIQYSYGLSPKEQIRGKYEIGEGIIGKVVKTGEPIIVPSISNDPVFLDKTGSRENIDKEKVSFICVPIMDKSEVIGTLSVDKIISENNLLNENLNLLTIITGMIFRNVRIHQLNQEEQALEEENRRLNEQLKEKYKPKNIIGNSKVMQNVYSLIHKISVSSTTVLILGESGVGKELVANSIHYQSDRFDKPFIKINCGAIPVDLVESELFGHEKGAFTGAINMRKGKFEQADQGTIFIDEVGELSLELQVKLLRVLQEREIDRVGGAKTIKVDVRIIAATNRNLEELVNQGKFREDLYYRLNVFPIIVPSLRERKSDILLLTDFFIQRYNKQNNKNVRRISTPAIDMLMSYHWPGNVRELENCIERAVILTEEGVVHSYHLPPTLQTGKSSKTSYSNKIEDHLQSVEYEMIVEALKETHGNMAKSAKMLGLTERIIGLRLKKYGINYKSFRK